MDLPRLDIFTYHYVRDLPNTPFPKIKGLLLDDFRKQVKSCCAHYEMATLESALAYLAGQYTPKRNLCLLTFDDGLKEHFAEVTPILADHGVQGLFFPITSCAGGSTVAPVHMNHFLMATLDFDTYRGEFWEAVRAVAPDAPDGRDAEADTLARTYPWDNLETARFKYVFNFLLDPGLRDGVIASMFREHFGDEERFGRSLYVNWEEARAMQRAGMAIGGHSQRHRPLAALTGDALEGDIAECRRALSDNLREQERWPFCFPYGKKNSYSDEAIGVLKTRGFCCAFTTETTVNHPGQDLFTVGRADCRHAPVE
jgi:peptidoglycan/xylan/chitin deacetylase (PgdA/CDA1 family)